MWPEPPQVQQTMGSFCSFLLNAVRWLFGAFGNGAAIGVA